MAARKSIKYTDLQEMDAETGLAQLQAISCLIDKRINTPIQMNGNPVPNYHEFSSQMKCIIKESQVVKSQLLWSRSSGIVTQSSDSGISIRILRTRLLQGALTWQFSNSGHQVIDSDALRLYVQLKLL
ncbi:uncharacterized protein PHALS_02141 [Plasmopara halstedii]|uniref:Uncharacterized protein n=1 Tax=Plasmopara halstedii TaxID=4781 RepID=A0A0P1APQ2_PLAHL|nr:uncharacterized protein PHALS_13249 [Plasmopara halstedii]XP_024582237.1 uncharacterized protein PHALS_02141 [Plasmopara halstedii]CEG43024.1 hypothetical protein PHALS_13249 [Plasmopara halstedii]CEG45868.1 hypothetical protein PHALS_02141 [Plasmopara halstedii]|eukprot:XP_024579393.1 hypothetical protein PHALS_13249 [Plasmopara halstedii]